MPDTAVAAEAQHGMVKCSAAVDMQELTQTKTRDSTDFTWFASWLLSIMVIEAQTQGKSLLEMGIDSSQTGILPMPLLDLSLSEHGYIWLRHGMFFQWNGMCFSWEKTED